MHYSIPSGGSRNLSEWAPGPRGSASDPIPIDAITSMLYLIVTE